MNKLKIRRIFKHLNQNGIGTRKSQISKIGVEYVEVVTEMFVRQLLFYSLIRAESKRVDGCDISRILNSRDLYEKLIPVTSKNISLKKAKKHTISHQKESENHTLQDSNACNHAPEELEDENA